MNKKRTIIATIWGAVFGVVCIFMQKYGAGVSFWPSGASSLIHHAVMGFTIGVSSLRIHWAPHGILWGFLFAIFLAIGWWGGPQGFWRTLGIVTLWGFLIELITTVGFKAKIS